MINQTTARAMRATLQQIAHAYLKGAVIPLDDMRLVWQCLDIAAREEEGAELFPHDREFLALMGGEAALAVAAE